MKYILTFIWLLITLHYSSQQVVTICEENQTSFTYSSTCTTAGTYVWTIDGQIQSETESSIMIEWSNWGFGIHMVEVSFSATNGCDPTPITYTVSTLECDNSTLYAPNAFTPDDNEPNNIWSPKAYNLLNIHYTIYNRWGKMIFESYDINIGWDGTHKGLPCKQDVYIYRIDWIDNLQNNHQEYGHINLLR